MAAYSRVSKGILTPCSSQNRTWTSRFIRLFKMSRPISKLALTICLVKQFNHSFRLFNVYQFCILCTPSLLPTFEGYHHYYGYIRPCCWFMKAYYILRVLRLMISPLCFSYVLVFLQTFLPIQHTQPVQVLQFRQPHPAFRASLPTLQLPSPKEKENGMRHFVPVCKSRRLYPGCS